MSNACNWRSLALCLIVPILTAFNPFAASAQTKAKCSSSCAEGCGKTSKPNTVNTSTAAGRPLVCKLSSAEMRERKATVIAALKETMLERTELPNGYSFRFASDDTTIDRLVTFIKTERACCGFFTFGLTVTEDAAVLTLTGVEGSKEFVTAEIGL